ncbi:unnamed protein product [Vitrella brassicaformis CCMP3155]|uniref:Uncharacterized protein n=1 Tax=Vitrella brassicaformis (strain CCMP3155) TaxID=1169540 RepID=A0A0G4GF05_VITBC|nr:unnamed protein product [Vitrella brassicaformis CCMP3155]|eukprot:CEM28068.1 unnamed protein product [Vitrella brassicaformis CCMP3155]
MPLEPSPKEAGLNATNQVNGPLQDEQPVNLPCMFDTDCSTEGLFGFHCKPNSDGVSGECVRSCSEAEDDKDPCPPATHRCSGGGNGLCVPCAQTGDVCTDGGENCCSRTCKGGLCAPCDETCEADADCLVEGQTCLAEIDGRRQCGYCFNEGDCPGSSVCNRLTFVCGSAEAQCTSNTNCPPSSPVCNTEAGTCGPCLFDTDCTDRPATPVCRAGSCGPSAGQCPTGEIEFPDGSGECCIENGSSCSNDDECCSRFCNDSDGTCRACEAVTVDCDFDGGDDCFEGRCCKPSGPSQSCTAAKERCSLNCVGSTCA